MQGTDARYVAATATVRRAKAHMPAEEAEMPSVTAWADTRERATQWLETR